jgi:carboxylesterase type B
LLTIFTLPPEKFSLYLALLSFPGLVQSSNEDCLLLNVYVPQQTNSEPLDTGRAH